MTANLDLLRNAIDGDRARLVEALGLRRDGAGGRFFCSFCQADGKQHSDGDLSVEAGFRCHKCGWSGDGISLIRSVRGCDFPAAVEFARGIYGVSAAEGPASKTDAAAGRKQSKIHPSMDEAARAVCWSIGQKSGTDWSETRRDIYRNAEGDAVAAVLRFDRADGATNQDGKPLKEYRPVHAVDGGWRAGDPPGRWPLFNLPELIAADAAETPVHIVEGEKAALAGASIGLLCTTSAHGAKSPSKTDWSALRNRVVVVHPDNDAAGIEYAEAVAGFVNGAGALSVKIVPLPGLPAKGDMADFISNRPATAPESMRAKIEALVEESSLWVPKPEPEKAMAGAAPIEDAKAGRPFACTDLGNAERMVAYYGNQIRWDTARKCWRVWDGRRWAVDSALRVNALAADTARNIRHEAAAAPTGGSRDMGSALFAWGVKSESRDRLAAMLEVLKSRPGIAVAADALDADPMALNVLNGTIDLRTGALRPHNRDDLITKLVPVDYRPGLRDERWERFLDSSTKSDAGLIAFMQIAAGYTLTGDTSEEKLFIIYGAENSGKTTFLESMRGVTGEYARTIQTDLLTKTKDARGGGAASPELAGLAGARLAVGSEMEQGREMAEALAKNLTGGEMITARHLYAELFDFTPQFKIWLAVNHCPKVSADDGAIWRRILRIGFDHTVPPEQRDKTLKPYLRNPAGGAPAVLAWAVEGCLRWQREGLEIPEAVRKSTAAYRDESDPLATFFEDCLRFNPQAWTSWSDIWRTYSEHAGEMGVAERYRVSPKRLQERLRQLDCVAERRMVGRGWRGVEVSTDWQDGSHDGYDGYDASSKSFSSNSFMEKLSKQPTYPTYPSCPTVKPLFSEGDAADLPFAEQESL